MHSSHFMTKGMKVSVYEYLQPFPLSLLSVCKSLDFSYSFPSSTSMEGSSTREAELGDQLKGNTESTEGISLSRKPYGDEEEVVIEKGPQRLNGVAGEGDGLTEEDEMFQRLVGTQGRADDFDNILIMLLERCHNSFECLYG